MDVFQCSSGNNGVTGLHNSYPRVIATLKVLLELVYVKDLPPLYCTIGGSLNISFSRVFCEAGVLSGSASLAHETLI